VLKPRDPVQLASDKNALDVIEGGEERILAPGASLIQRFAAWWLFRNKSPLEI
jgi:hypothetical protein